jgi:hypothetical protein
LQWIGKLCALVNWVGFRGGALLHCGGTPGKKLLVLRRGEDPEPLTLLSSSARHQGTSSKSNKPHQVQ